MVLGINLNSFFFFFGNIFLAQFVEKVSLFTELPLNSCQKSVFYTHVGIYSWTLFSFIDLVFTAGQLLSLERPDYKVQSWLAYGNLDFERFSAIPRTNEWLTVPKLLDK